MNLASLRTAPPERLLLVGLIAVVCVTFGPTIRHDFIRGGGHDDDLNILENQVFQELSVRGIVALWSEHYWLLYIPVSQTAWALLSAVGRLLPQAVGPPGFNPHVFHAASVLLHAANVLLVFAILRKLAASTLPAAAGALLFALHPLQVEPVCWASAIKDLLACALSFGAILTGPLREEPPSPPPGTPRRLWSALRPYVGSANLFAFAVLAKPSAIMLPLVAAALLLVLGREALPRIVRGTALWVLLVGPLWVIVNPSAQALWVEDPTPWRDRPRVAADALAFYAAKLFWPTGIAVDYARVPRLVLESSLSGMMAGVVLGVFVLLALTGSRPLWGATALFVLPLLPVLGLQPFLQQNISTVADRYAYQAILGPAAALALGLTALRRPPWTRAVPAAVVLLLGLVPYDLHLSRFWKDADTLFARCEAQNPKSWLCQQARGEAARRQGDLVSAERYFRVALMLRPANWVTEQRLAMMLYAAGRKEEALEHRRIYEDGLVAIMLSQADRLGAAGEIQEAGKLYLSILQGRPDNALARERLARIIAHLQKQRER